MFAPSNNAPAGDAAPRQLQEGMKHVLSMFADGVVAVGRDKLLAGDELSPGNVKGFKQAMGLPEDPTANNALVTFAKVTAGSSPGESDDARAAYAQHPGVTTENLSACQELRDLCEGGLRSFTKTQLKIMMRRQKRVVTRISRLLHKDHAALKLVQTFAGLGFFGSAAWLQWAADEKAWKIGSWAVVCIGAIRLLGNLMYNDAGAIHEGWKVLYVHLGLGSVAYAMEILRRSGVTIEANTTTAVASVIANLVPILGFYMRNIESTAEETVYKLESWRTGGPSAADVALLQPVLEKLRNYTTASQEALAVGSDNKPGNRTAATGKAAENETRGLADLLALDVEPSSTTWKDFFLSLVHEAIVKSPSLIYALAAGIILVAAAVGNAKALADNAVVLNIVLVEIGLGIKNTHLTADQLQYRLLLLILSRFGSIFFFAARMIHEYRLTGRRDIYDREPEFAAIMAHCNAVFVCIFGLAVIPTIGLFDRVVKKAFCCVSTKRVTSNTSVGDGEAANPDDELDDAGLNPGQGSQAHQGSNPSASFDPAKLIDDFSDGEDDEGDVPPPDAVSDEQRDDEDQEAAEVLKEMSEKFFLPVLEELSRTFGGDQELPVSLLPEMEELAGITGSNQMGI